MGKKGFSLVEIMVSLAILAIILIALIQGAVVTIRHNAELEHRKVALGLGESLINTLATLQYGSNFLEDTNSDTTFISSPSPDPNGNGKVYILDKDKNGAYSNEDINDPEDAEKGIDHPSSSSSYAGLSPITKVGPKTYYKIWGIENLSNMKRIVVVIYWFEGGKTDAEHAHYVSLATCKRRK